jgi:hypothetical protein
MTILNIANDGFFNVLIALHRTLATHGPMERERLQGLCSPGSDADANRPRQTLLRWTQLGLFKETKDGKLALDKAYRDPNLLPSICRRLLFKDENNQSFWDSEGTLAADFTRAMAFVLSQDIYAGDFDAHAQVQALERRQLKDESRRVLQNDVRWNGLRFWGDYLGFFWVDQRRWPDPTSAIREDLKMVFGNQKELSAQDFTFRLAEHLPVVDGGRYRIEIENVLDPAEWHRPDRSELLSTSLSRALWRLCQPGGPIQFESRADAGDIRVLQRAGGRDWQKFSHVLLRPGV